MDVKAETRRKALSEAAGAAQTIDKLIPPYLEFCALDGKSEGTIKSYTRYLRPLRFWWAGRLPSEMTRGDCQDIFPKVQKIGIPDADGNPQGKGSEERVATGPLDSHMQRHGHSSPICWTGNWCRQTRGPVRRNLL